MLENETQLGAAAHDAETFGPGAKPTNPKDAIGSDKLPIHLWPMSATAFGCIGLANGATKYGRANWREAGVRPSIYVDAAIRHITDWFEGNDTDPEDGVHNLAGALACLGILVDALVTGKLNDDRNYNGIGWRVARSMMEPHVKRLKEMRADRSPKHYSIADSPVADAGYQSCYRELMRAWGYSDQDIDRIFADRKRERHQVVQAFEQATLWIDPRKEKLATEIREESGFVAKKGDEEVFPAFRFEGAGTYALRGGGFAEVRAGVANTLGGRDVPTGYCGRRIDAPQDGARDGNLDCWWHANGQWSQFNDQHPFDLVGGCVDKTPLFAPEAAVPPGTPATFQYEGPGWYATREGETVVLTGGKSLVKGELRYEGVKTGRSSLSFWRLNGACGERAHSLDLVGRRIRELGT